MAFHTFEQEEDYPLALKLSFLDMVDGSVGSRAYRFLYRALPDAPEDVIKNGDLACAYFASTILHVFGLINNGVHTTVTETIKDMEQSGWQKCDEPGEGRVVIWGIKMGDDKKPHFHIGICLSTKEAVSHYAPEKTPYQHPISGFLKTETGDERSVVAFYKHPRLEE